MSETKQSTYRFGNEVYETEEYTEAETWGRQDWNKRILTAFLGNSCNKRGHNIQITTGSQSQKPTSGSMTYKE